MAKILLADDEVELARAVSAILKFNNYEVDCVHDGEAAYKTAMENDYDALVFDIMMPKMSGVEAVAALRKNNVDTPVILLTAKAEFSDRISGLDAGADDYLTKPFNTGELLARIRALLRRAGDKKPEQLSCGNVTFNTETLEIKTTTSSFRLGPREARMLELLITRRGTPLNEQYFLDRLFDDGEASHDGAVFLHISYLRTKLAAINANLKIKTTDDGKYMLTIE